MDKRVIRVGVVTLFQFIKWKKNNKEVWNKPITQYLIWIKEKKNKFTNY